MVARLEGETRGAESATVTIRLTREAPSAPDGSDGVVLGTLSADMVADAPIQVLSSRRGGLQVVGDRVTEIVPPAKRHPISLVFRLLPTVAGSGTAVLVVKQSSVRLTLSIRLPIDPGTPPTFGEGRTVNATVAFG